MPRNSWLTIISGSVLYVVTAMKVEWTIHCGEIADLLSKNGTFAIALGMGCETRQKMVKCMDAARELFQRSRIIELYWRRHHDRKIMFKLQA